MSSESVEPGAGGPGAWLRRLSVVRDVDGVLERGLPVGTTLRLHVRIVLELFLVFKLVKDSDLTVRAASTAYTFVFAMVPLLTTSLAFFTAFSGIETSREAISKYLYAWLLPGAAREVQVYLDQFAHAAAAAGTVSSLVFLVSVLLLLRSLEETYNRIWRVPIPRSWGDRVKTLAVFFLTGAIGASLMVLVSRESGQLAAQLQKFPVPGLGPLLLTWSFEGLSLVLSWILFFSATWVLPAAPVRKSAALLSGIVMGTVWHLLKIGFSWYISRFAGYDSIYGAVGTVPVFLLWLYLTLILFLAGAYLAYVHQNLRPLVNAWKAGGSGDTTLGGASAGLAFYAVTLAVALGKAWYERKGPQTEEALQLRTGLNACLAAEALQKLIRAQLVVPVSLSSEVGYLLAIPPELLTPAEIIRIVSDRELHIPRLDGVAAEYHRIQEVFEQAQAQGDHVLGSVHLTTFIALPSSAQAEVSQINA